MPILLQLAQSYSNPDDINYKLAYLREQVEQQLLNLGDLAYEDQVQLAMLGETIIVGGYLRTELIAANSIVGNKIASNAITTQHIQAGAITADKIAANSITTDKIDSNSITADKIDSNAIATRHIQADAITADKLDVQTLSAISADLGTVTAGSISGVTITGGTVRTDSGNNRIELSNNLLRSYSGGVRRVQLDYDSLDFYNSQNIHVGSLLGSYSSDKHKMITYSSRGVEIIASTDFVAGSNEDPDNGARVIVYSDYDGFAPSVSIEAGTDRSTNFASISVGDNGYGIFLGKGFTCYGDFEVFGDKSAVVETENYGTRKLYALETPESRFVTYIETELEIGEHYIEIEPMFRETISEYFVVPHIQNMAEVSILERGEKGFRVLVGEKKAEVVFEINGIRKGYEDVYMEKAGCGFEQYHLSRLKRGVINETSDSGHE